MIKGLLSILLDMFVILYFPILWLIPRNKNIRLFTEWDGDPVGDNPWWLYTNLTGSENYWITHNKAKHGVAGHVYIYTLQSLCLHLSASVFIYSHNIRTQFIWPLTIGSKKVLFWHGVPLKKIGLQRNRAHLNWLWKIYNRVVRLRLSSTNLALCQSQYERSVLSEAFALKQSDIAVTGYPRFLSLIPQHRDVHELRRVRILYAPTLRPDSSVLGSVINNFLQYSRFYSGVCEFFIKVHPAQKIDVQMYADDKLKIIMGGVIDFSDFSAVITDYSGVTVEALLCNCPVYIYAPDYNDYRKQVGFNELFDLIYSYAIEDIAVIVQDILGPGSLNVCLENAGYYLGSIPDEGIFQRIEECLR